MKAMQTALVALGLGLVVLAAGCAPGAQFPDPLPSAVLGDPPLFAKTAPPAAADPARRDGCAALCLAQWQPVYEGCMTGDHVMPGDPSACTLSARKSVAACVDACKPSSPLSATTCTVTCAVEAKEVVLECETLGVAGRGCHLEGQDVYRTCWEAECMGGAFPESVALGFPSAAAADEPPAEPEELVTCEVGCEALESKSYLACIGLPELDVDLCRERAKDVYDVCVVKHCTHPAE